jgi:hypothetical protein
VCPLGRKGNLFHGVCLSNESEDRAAEDSDYPPWVEHIRSQMERDNISDLLIQVTENESVVWGLLRPVRDRVLRLAPDAHTKAALCISRWMLK